MATTLMRRNPAWYLSSFLMDVILPAIAAVYTYFSPNGLLRTPAKSGRDVLRAVLSPTAVLVGSSSSSSDSSKDSSKNSSSSPPKGLYFNGDLLAQTATEARDAVRTAALWHDSVRLAALQEGETVLQDWR